MKTLFIVGSRSGDVEIMAFAAILQTDIYVANKLYLTEDGTNVIQWSFMRASFNVNKLSRIGRQFTLLILIITSSL